MQDQGAGQLAMFAMAGARAQAAVNTVIQEHEETEDPRTPELIVATWNAVASDLGIPAVRTLTEGRRRKIKARLREPEFSIARILEKIRRSAFLKGENDRGWVVTLDFVIRSEDSYTRILEGMYDGRRNAKRTNRVEAAEGKYDGL